MGRAASKEEVTGTKLSCTKIENLLFPFKKKIRRIISHWSIKLKATGKPFPRPWDEDVLPLAHMCQAGRRLLRLGGPTSTASSPGAAAPRMLPVLGTICTSLLGTIFTSLSTSASPHASGEQLLLPGTLRFVILGSSPAHCLDLENLFR